MTYEEVARRYLTPLELGHWYNNHENAGYIDMLDTCPSEWMCISQAFAWMGSPEGNEYWYQLYLRVKRGEMPKEILVPLRYIIKHCIL